MLSVTREVPYEARQEAREMMGTSTLRRAVGDVLLPELVAPLGRGQHGYLKESIDLIG